MIGFVLAYSFRTFLFNVPPSSQHFVFFHLHLVQLPSCILFYQAMRLHSLFGRDLRSASSRFEFWDLMRIHVNCGVYYFILLSYAPLLIRESKSLKNFPHAFDISNIQDYFGY